MGKSSSVNVGLDGIPGRHKAVHVGDIQLQNAMEKKKPLNPNSSNPASSVSGAGGWEGGAIGAAARRRRGGGGSSRGHVDAARSVRSLCAEAVLPGLGVTHVWK